MADKDTTYKITLSLEDLPTYAVRAAYVSVDERMYPGWTLLKNDAGTIVAMVRSGIAALIQRTDDPGAAAKPAGTPSPASMPAQISRTTTAAAGTSGIVFTSETER